MERGPIKFEHSQVKSEDKKSKGELTISMSWVEGLLLQKSGILDDMVYCLVNTKMLPIFF